MYSLLAGPLRVERLTIPIRGLPPALIGIRLVQLSDFHFDGWRLSRQLLDQAIATANQAAADLILLTGDYVTDDPDPIDELAHHLRSLKSRLGTYAVLGNHDLYYPHSYDKISTALQEAGIQVLWDQVAYPFEEKMALVGLRDYWSSKFKPARVMEQLCPDTPRIVLAHNPDSAQSLQQWRVDLQLSGHTHGGQLVIPGMGPIVSWLKPLRRKLPLPWRRWLPSLIKGSDKTVQHWEWSEGLHQVGTNLLYTNRGLGTHFPGRLFCPPEVTVLTLVAAETGCSPQDRQHCQSQIPLSD